MNKALLDLYSDYLLSSFSLATATGLAALVDQAYSHDQITRFLDQPRYNQKQYWQTIKPVVRQVERDEGSSWSMTRLKKSLIPMKANWSVIIMITPKVGASKGSIC